MESVYKVSHPVSVMSVVGAHSSFCSVMLKPEVIFTISPMRKNPHQTCFFCMKLGIS